MSSLQVCQSTFTHVLRRFITCILLSAMLIIHLYKTGIVISSYALFLCVGVTSSSECHPSPLLFRASRAQMGNGRRSLPFFLLRGFSFTLLYLFIFLLAAQTVLNKLKKHFYWMTWKNVCVLTLHLTLIKFFADVSVFLYLFGMDMFYCERDTLSFAVPLSNVFYHVLTFKWLKIERSGE